MFRNLVNVQVEHVDPHHRTIRITAQARATGATCPACGTSSDRMHSRYQRHLTDTPLGGYQVRLTLRARRLFCDTSTCPKRTFAQQVDGSPSATVAVPAGCRTC